MVRLAAVGPTLARRSNFRICGHKSNQPCRRRWPSNIRLRALRSTRVPVAVAAGSPLAIRQRPAWTSRLPDATSPHFPESTEETQLAAVASTRAAAKYTELPGRVEHVASPLELAQGFRGATCVAIAMLSANNGAPLFGSGRLVPFGLVDLLTLRPPPCREKRGEQADGAVVAAPLQAVERGPGRAVAFRSESASGRGVSGIWNRPAFRRRRPDHRIAPLGDLVQHGPVRGGRLIPGGG